MLRPLQSPRHPQAWLLIALALAATMCAAPSPLSAALGVAAVVLASVGGFFAGHVGATGTSVARSAASTTPVHESRPHGFDDVARLRFSGAVARLKVTSPR